jgi:predicted ABC-type transport system involved in lysophospholipase L1 biosynthesis ATPase subunit
VLALLDELRLEEGFSLAVATHDPEVAARSDRVVTISDGRVVEVTDR